MKQNNTLTNQAQGKTTRVLFGATGALAGVTLLAGALLTSANSHAEVLNRNISSTATVTVAATCSMTGNITQEHSATLVNGQVKSDGIGYTTIQTMCNDPGGYAIYAIGYTGGEDGVTAGTNTVLQDSNLGTSYDIPTNATLSANASAWAMKLTPGTNPPTINYANNTFAAVPSAYTRVATYESGMTIANPSSIVTTYGASIAQTQPAGTYSGKVKYILVHPSTNSDASYSDRYMQNIDEWGGTLQIGDITTAMDMRDNTIYKVAKLKDGNIWMLDNLQLDPTTAVLTSGNTNASAQAIKNFYSGTDHDGMSGWTSVAVKSAASGFTTYTDPLVNVSYTADGTTYTKDTVVAQHYGAGSGKRGVYYNYCAATVGTYCYDSASGVDKPDTLIDAEYDICPSGWRLPTGGSGGEFQALYNQYSTTQVATNENSLQYNLSTPLSGFFYGSTQNNLGSYGDWWSSRYGSAASMYSLYVLASGVYPTDYYGRHRGFSVRCVAPVQ